MRAIIAGDTVGIDGLQYGQLAMPEPGPSQVRIRVAAAGVNYPDVLLAEDRYQFRPRRPFSPGGEMSGTIDKLGEGVTELTVGDRVVAVTLHGALAEYAIADARTTCRMPDGIDFRSGASLMLTYGTMIHAYRDRARLEAGETVLILGAAGGIGLAAVQLARAMGAKVVAAASTAEKAAIAARAGADRTLVYPAALSERDEARALSEQFKQACGPDGPHVIVDPVGGAYSEPALRSIAWHGRFLAIGFPAGIAQIPLNIPLLKACQIIGVFYGGELQRDASVMAETATALFDLCLAGTLHPEIERVFPLSEGVAAIRLLSQRKAMGKVVVVVAEE